MDFDVLDSLDDLGTSVSSLKIKEKHQRNQLVHEDLHVNLRYSGVFEDDDAVKSAIRDGPKSIEFTCLVEWLSKELQILCGLESCIHALTDPEDYSSFLLEVSSFLKELHCPYKALLSGPISQRLLDVESRTTLLDYLCTELQAARLLQHKRGKKKVLEIEMEESSTAASLLNAIRALGLDADVNDSSVLLSNIQTRVKKIMSDKPGLISEAAFNETLSEEQSESLDSLYKDFYSDYTVRREMLLTRLDVTIQSFKWGEGSKGKENKILEAYLPRRNKLKKLPSVKLSDVLAAREGIFIIEKTSSAELVKNTKSSLNKYLIPAVPDRGGRPKEQRPPVEMPNWMKRSTHGGGRGDHHGGGWRGQGKKFKGNRRGGGGGGGGGGSGGGGGGRRGGSFDAAGTY